MPDIKYPIIKAKIPAINWDGTISTLGYFLTTSINTAKDIGIEKAAKLPIVWPGERVFPTINIIPDMARIIEINVVLEIFSFKKKYPKIARKIVWVWIIKLVFATVVLYMANT